MTNLAASRDEYQDTLPPDWDRDFDEQNAVIKLDRYLLKQAIEEALEKWDKKKTAAQNGPEKEASRVNGFTPHQPFAVFYGNSVNLGPIGGQTGKNSTAATGLEEISRLIRHYEKLVAEKDKKLLDLQIELDGNRLMDDDWNEPI